MANTYTQIYIQVVFSVSSRDNLITKNFRNELEKYITGIVSNRNQKLLAIYCMPDHVHILLSLNPDIKLSDLMRDIKAGSSKHINDMKWVRGKFSWQVGYGAFSYSISQIDAVVKYILNQELHHKKKTFKEEYVEFLEKFSIVYKEEYLFDFFD
ncbi:MAG: IS200/IS605 family transposase [Candidatus Kapabacteria bacterium]|nr:IS200/IS605 family transposase [Ignavibacteriota bacterium]MCW5883619.1 IS200/IS605 family transposase [Candidatus Kapabacteria bacterium]